MPRPTSSLPSPLFPSTSSSSPSSSAADGLYMSSTVADARCSSVSAP
eukprot:CAMPEP_0171922200 /NCGR_PEP_ID=MMETSP0993-20121228/20879_1 /TAXON_ID=483369 /ORGANISM="non described non described, Strain CCMP2098" /LENGTH=46 /DNA_ID= /DNA_START= /DNA_END= /DNA_ORIENTATION=